MKVRPKNAISPQQQRRGCVYFYGFSQIYSKKAQTHTVIIMDVDVLCGILIYTPLCALAFLSSADKFSDSEE